MVLECLKINIYKYKYKVAITIKERNAEFIGFTMICFIIFIYFPVITFGAEQFLQSSLVFGIPSYKGIRYS